MHNNTMTGVEQKAAKEAVADKFYTEIVRIRQEYDAEMARLNAMVIVA